MELNTELHGYTVWTRYRHYPGHYEKLHILLSGERTSLKRREKRLSTQCLLNNTYKVVILSPSNSTLYVMYCACPGTQERLSWYFSAYVEKKSHGMRALNTNEEITPHLLLPTELCGCDSELNVDDRIKLKSNGKRRKREYKAKGAVKTLS